MDNYSVVLANDLVVKTLNFGGILNIGFNKEGKVNSFIYAGQKYIALFEFKSNSFMDYCEETSFNKLKRKEVEKVGDKYNGVDKKLWDSFKFKNYSDLIPAEHGDTLYGLLRDSSGLCYNYHTWLYSNPYLIPINPVLAPNAPQAQLCDTFEQGSVARSFFDEYKNQIFFDTNQNDIRLIGEIASLLKSAGEKTALAFQNFVLTGVDTINFNFVSFQNGFPRDAFLEYKKGLILWLKMLKEYEAEINKLGNEEKLFIYIDVMYRHNMLSALSVQQRINILKVLVEKKPLMNWYWVNFSIGFVHKEDLALYIIKSIDNVTDANDFLDKLVSTNVIKTELKDHQGVVISTNYTTLYKLLFYRMDDYGGADNFTAYVKELERIVLLKNGISTSSTPLYTTSQIQNLTQAQFIWRERGPKKGRVKYKITSITDTKINFEETIIVKTEEKEVYNPSTEEIPVIGGFIEIATEVAKRNLHLNHFDLVSIHFYQDPSFIDLSTDQTYVGKNYLTFAGFVDYLLEKEDTKIAEDVFNAALFTISLTVGFGEFVAAIRTYNIARAVCGLGMVVSDGALYLNQNTPFRNYIITTYGIEKGNEILNNMAILSTIASLGTGAIIGSGILKAYSREQGLKLVGTGEAILKDSNALSHLTANEINALKEAVKKVRNELYSLRNNQQAVSTIVRTKSTVLFNKFPSLKNELEILTELERFRFYDDFVSISEELLISLDKTPDFIPYWNGLSDTEKIVFKFDKIRKYKIWYQVRTEAKALDKFNLGIIDVDSGKYGIHECRTWVDMETQSRGIFEPKPYGKIGDVIANSGDYNGLTLSGKTIDFWGQPSNWTTFYQGSKRTKQTRKLLESIDAHFVKYFNSTKFPGESLDIFIMDLRYLDQDQAIKTLILNKINDPNYFYKTLRDNPNFFILINE